jgi:transcriptional regulator with PAS, ATPase and Fis domain/AraC-like DNA-binding protein
MELKDGVESLDKAEINSLTNLLKSNLDNKNIKYLKIEIKNSDIKSKVNKNDNILSFNLKGLLSGTVSITLKDKNTKSSLNEIKREFELLINRYISCENQNNKFGIDKSLIGVSDYIIEIEKFIHQVTDSQKNILIEGDYGCEKLTLASAIHYNSKQHNEFYELNCERLAVYKNAPRYIEKIALIESGTLFINHIDLLCPLLQNKLLDCLFLIKDKVRLMVSSTKNLSQEVEKGKFCSNLFFYINDLNIKLPRLSERKEDIPHILDAMINQHDADKKLSNEVINLLTEYSWPENLSELESVIYKLIKLSKNRTISLSDIEKHFPHILAGKKTIVDHDLLIKNLINREFDFLNLLHPSLKKSLTYIAVNYDQEINLDILSSQSHVSPSHLSYLYRSNFGISFKVIISKLRVEIIKRYFIENPKKSITESALDIGFGDLSHFEKTFKKITGLTPKKFKSNQLTTH